MAEWCAGLAHPTMAEALGLTRRQREYWVTELNRQAGGDKT